MAVNFDHAPRPPGMDDGIEKNRMSTTTKVVIGLSVVAGLGLLVAAGGLAWQFGVTSNVSIWGYVLPPPVTAQWVSMVAVGSSVATVAGAGALGLGILGQRAHREAEKFGNLSPIDI